MSEMIDNANRSLAEAKEASNQAKEELREIEANIEKVQSVNLSMPNSFPKTEEELKLIEANLEAMRGHKEAAAALLAKANALPAAIKEISDLADKLESYLKEISRLDNEKQYDDANRLIDESMDACASKDFGAPLDFQQKYAEMASWARCYIYIHLAEDKVAAGEDPMDDATMDDLLAKADALSVGIHDEREKGIFFDYIVGYRCLNRLHKMERDGYNYDDLTGNLEFLKKLPEELPEPSPRAAERIKMLRDAVVAEYNFLAIDAFDARRVYPDAEIYFGLRDNFQAEEIEHVDYREAEGVQDFKMRFYIAEARRATDEEFARAVDGYATSIQSDDSFEFEVLVRYLLLDDISESKEEALLNAINKLSFEHRVIVLGSALPLGLNLPRQERILNSLVRETKKTLNLEHCAKALRNCKDILDSSLQTKFGYLLKDLLRSPRAHKVCVKSNSPDIHVLYGEDENNFRKPLGKMMKHSEIKAWGVTTSFCYGFFIVFLLSALLIAAEVVIYLMLKDQPYCTYLLIAPPFLWLLLLHCVVTARHGRDERGSAVFRRVLGINGLIFGAASLVYFIMPTTIPWLAPFGYTLIIFAAILGLWGFFFLKDRRKVVTSFIYVPLLLIEIASLVFLILDLMNGTI